MKLNRGLAALFAFLLFACKPATPATVTIIDKDQIIALETQERVPSKILAQAGITLKANDRVLVNGLVTATDQVIPYSPISLQIRRTANIMLITPQGKQQIQTSASTVGEALTEASYWLHESDKIEPNISSPIKDGMTITVLSEQSLTVSVDGKSLQIQSSARTVGEALAEAGIPLIGLDTSVPAENERLPSDGQIKTVRVSESVVLAQKPIPFDSDTQASSEIPLDQTQILQPGELGLSVQRIRIRYEDGKEISRLSEDETIVRPPKTRIMGYGTKVEIKTAVVDGVKIEYWRAVQMYATSYSPCNSGVANCGATTASGKHLQKGMLAVNRTLYYGMLGQQLYIPGYGAGTIQDLCGGCTGKPWIDLGYSDSDYRPWHSWVTVYFLTPVPATIIYDLQ